MLTVVVSGPGSVGGRSVGAPLVMLGLGLVIAVPNPTGLLAWVLSVAIGDDDDGWMEGLGGSPPVGSCTFGSIRNCCCGCCCLVCTAAVAVADSPDVPLGSPNKADSIDGGGGGGGGG